jgi:ribonuclease VapC
MVVDASAIIAILHAEPERPLFLRALLRAPALRMTPVNWLEAAMVIDSRSTGRAEFEALIARSGITIVPVDVSLMRAAYEAWRTFGKGRHPARLNLGDCFAYALSKETGEPLLFKGDDFRKTDITPAL